MHNPQCYVSGTRPTQSWSVLRIWSWITLVDVTAEYLACYQSSRLHIWRAAAYNKTYQFTIRKVAVDLWNSRSQKSESDESSDMYFQLERLNSICGICKMLSRLETLIHTVHYRYVALILIPGTPNKHPIARLWRQAICCILRVHSRIKI